MLMRDLLAYELSCQGMKLSAIAKQDGRSEKVIREVIERMAKQGSEALMEMAPLKVVESMLRRSQTAWKMAAATAAHAEQDTTRIAAIRAMMDADQRVLEILQSTGHLPRELGTLRHLVDVRSIAIQMIDAVRGLESGERTPAEVRAVFEAMVMEEEPPPRAIEGPSAP
jgi:hypothetical protein